MTGRRRSRELAARALALRDGDRELLPGLEPAAEVVGLDQAVHHRPRVLPGRDLPRDRPEVSLDSTT